MRRFRGGNARKQKRELSDATLRSVISGTDDAPEATAPVIGGVAAAVQEPYEEDEEERRGYLPPPVAAQEQGLAPINGFVFSRYVLGTATCSSCHYELMYYQDRDLLRRGFTFRCRVCQTMQTIALAEE